MMTRYLILLPMAALLSCSPPKFRARLAMEEISDTEVITYLAENNVHFDLLYRMKDPDLLMRFKNYGFDALTFVNLYNENGELLRTASGEKCEFQILHYIRDSLQKPIFKNANCDSCNFNIVFGKKARLIMGDEDKISQTYKVVIGWAKFLKSNYLIKQRRDELFKGIADLRERQNNLLIIGFSFDPDTLSKFEQYSKK